jgi:lysyl-tRNA synthetase class 1
VAGRLKGKPLKEKELVDLFFNTCKDNNVKNSDFFGTMYRILIDKDHGPRLAPFVISIGQKKAAKLLDAA